MSPQKKSPILRRLKSAIQKVKFLLSFDATRWIVSSIKRSPAPRPRRLSFKTPPSLLDCSDDYYDAGSSFALSRTSSISQTPSPDSEMSRSISDVSSGAGDDIDQRADRFIQNFYQQLKMERQISLELRYTRGKSLERTDSD